MAQRTKRLVCSFSATKTGADKMKAPQILVLPRFTRTGTQESRSKARRRVEGVLGPTDQTRLGSGAGRGQKMNVGHSEDRRPPWEHSLGDSGSLVKELLLFKRKWMT